MTDGEARARDEARTGAERAGAERAGAESALASPLVHVSVLVAIAAVLCLARVAKEPLDGDPAMYATIARTIARSGEWTHLTFNGDPYLNKPPLHFWLNALVFRAFGASTFTAALLPGLFGVADVVLLYLACRAMFPGWRTAFAAGLVYLTTPEVVHWSRGVHLETLVTFWVLLGIVAAFWSVERPVATLLVWVAAAGGWLAKGPQGLFPLALAALLWAREGVALVRLRSPWTVVGGLVALAAAGPWLWARVGEGTGFASAYFGGQIGHVLFGGRVLGRGPLWYVEKLARTYWPWLPVAAAGLVLLARRWGTSLGARTWLLYAALVFIVISLAAGKKSRYLFQLYPALAVAAASALAAASARVPRLLEWLAAAAAVAALVVGALGDHVSTPQALHSREALAIAARLDGEPVLITRRTQWGEPQFGKILGFYAASPLHACRERCADEAPPGTRVVARTDELGAVLAAFPDAAVVARTESLALIRVAGPAGAAAPPWARPPASSTAATAAPAPFCAGRFALTSRRVRS